MRVSKNKAIAAIFTMALATGTLFGCSQSDQAASDNQSSQSQNTASETQGEPQDRTIADMRGDEVVVPADADTVMTVNSVATQMVLMLGGEDAAATMGRGFDYSEGSLNQAMFPGLAGKPTITGTDVTVENVAAIDPGLVLNGDDDTIEALRGAGIPTAYVSVTSPETIVEAVRLIGDALGGEAAEKADAYEKLYDQVREEISSRSAGLADEDKPTVLYMRSTESTTGSGSMPDSWITAAGGINAAASIGLEGSGTDINAETIMNLDPDVIICESEKVRDEFLTGAAYTELAAVKAGAVYAAPFGTAVWSMGTAETVLQLSWAGTVINPELYADIDLDQRTRDFYQQFFGYELSDEQLDGIFHR